MQPPLMGTWSVEIIAVKAYEIHSDRYFELLVTRLDDATESPEAVLRTPVHALGSLTPEPGQRVVITFLMGQVTRVEVLNR
jgi:hypothetical protein